MNNVLVVVAHPDDEIIGVGGTIQKHIYNGDTVRVLYITGGETSSGYNRKPQAIDVCMSIGIENPIFFDLPDQKLDIIPHYQLNNSISEVINNVKPNIVYTHCREDLNLDHRIVHDSVMVACRPFNNVVKELYTFNVSKWDFGEYGSFNPNTFVDIEGYIDTKLMMMSIYESEVKQTIHPFSLDGIRTENVNNGFSFNIKYLEKFKQVYKII